MESLLNALYPVSDVLAVLFVLAIGALIGTLIVFYIIDMRQSKDAVRHNFPVLGRFRYLFSSLGGILPPVFLRNGPRRNAL